MLNCCAVLLHLRVQQLAQRMARQGIELMMVFKLLVCIAAGLLK
jgi:hypothetical protein